MIEDIKEGGDRAQVSTQLAAVFRVLDRAGFRIVAGGMRYRRECGITAVSRMMGGR